MTDSPTPDDAVGLGWIPKMSRAYEHLTILKKDIRDFLKRQPYNSVPEEQTWDDGSQTGIEWIFRATIQEKPSPEWPLRIGEFLYNLRSSLDHFAYFLSQPGSPPESERVEFPIFLHKGDYSRVDNRTGQPSRRSGLHKVRFMSTDVQTAIEKLQPYNGGHGDDPLWIFESLRNFDTHKDIHVVGATILKPSLGLEIRQRGTRLNGWELFPGPFEDGAILARCRVAFRAVEPFPAFDLHLLANNLPGVEVNFSQPFDVAFDPAGPGAGKSVLVVLEDAYLSVLALTFNISQIFASGDKQPGSLP